MLELLIYLIQLLWFFGLSRHALALLDAKKFAVRTDFDRVLTVSVSLGLIGYTLFWVYALARPVGWFLSLSSFVIGIHGAVQFVKTFDRRKLTQVLSNEWCFAFLAIVGLMYLSFPTLIHYKPQNLLDWISSYYFDASNDNVIPRYTAEIVRMGGRMAQPEAAWQVSDRTPLLSGIYLLFSFYTDTKTYQAVGVIFQLLLFLSAISFFKKMGLTARQLFWALTALVFCGFFHHGSIYLWPKLQSAHFTLLGLLLLAATDVSGVSELTQEQRWGTAGLCFVLAYLSHPGVVFATPLLLPFAITAVMRLRKNHLRIVYPLITGAILFLIWVVYQKLIDPPGDRLLKWHLAGVTEMNRIPLRELLRSQYGKMSWSEIFQVRWNNLKFQFSTDTDISTLRLFRKSEFHHMFQSFGIWWLGLLGLPKLLIKKARGDIPVSTLVIGIIAAQLIWITTIFLPDATPNHHNSYFTLCMIAFVLLIGLAETGTWALASATVLSATYFIGVWVIATPVEYLNAGKQLNAWDVPLVIALIAIYLVWSWRSFSRAPAPQSQFLE